ncbi:hypothetical protein [Thermoproteus tenax]|uniref:Predicted membrane component of Type II/IV secretion system n=1 Tax=Thermoproteus tenax (strain ATCC 35583 / DSM 2078 / JCM 9277 / NBRC 100435 / Kra 1) TaxID=768679 RepID=G4RPQ6_THETK|nr:hypothetical protein [Thermoproteus tenax]CCC81551.1 Predicted membrane component of Type II/IV secretion system [Thermoproteus tenax Kra 1]
MNFEIYPALLIAVFTALGGYIIRDLQALSILVALSSVAAFLLAILFNAPAAVLGLLGLTVAAVRIIRRPELRTWRQRIYRSRRRLEELEEMTKQLSRIHIMDLVPAGSKRAIHPKLVELVDMADKATSLGYQVSEPQWLKILRTYRRLLGSQFEAEATTIVGETDVFELE